MDVIVLARRAMHPEMGGLDPNPNWADGLYRRKHRRPRAKTCDWCTHAHPCPDHDPVVAVRDWPA